MTRETSVRDPRNQRFCWEPLALLLCATQGFAIFGVWRRHARRWAVVGTSVAVSSAARQSVGGGQQAVRRGAAVRGGRDRGGAVRGGRVAGFRGGRPGSGSGSREAGAPAATAQKTPQQKLEELESLYKQGLISESDYNAAKAKILAQITQ